MELPQGNTILNENKKIKIVQVIKVKNKIPKSKSFLQENKKNS